MNYRYICHWVNIKSKRGYVHRIPANSFEECSRVFMGLIQKRTNNFQDNYIIFDIHLDINNNEAMGEQAQLNQKYIDYHNGQ
jgi:hypothetical protein